MTKEPHFTADYLSELKIPALLLSGEHDVIKDSDFTFYSVIIALLCT